MWEDKRYHSLSFELKKIYGKKVYKLSLSGGMSCPNRDGTLDFRGCIFCSEGGSGDFATSSTLTITEQIEKAKLLVANKLLHTPDAKYIAYFQSYTNTHAPVPYLKAIFTEAINHPDIVILSIATRPDCLSEEVLALLIDLNKIKPIWIELGLQTIHNETAEFIRRGYPLHLFKEQVERLHQFGFTIIVHTILGLPKETKNDMLMTMEYLAKLPIQGIKLQLLHVLKGTDLGIMYERGELADTLLLEDYVDIVISCLELLPQDIVIHRITGDGPKKLLLSPLWSGNKRLVLNHIHNEMTKRDSYQGKMLVN